MKKRLGVSGLALAGMLLLSACANPEINSVSGSNGGATAGSGTGGKSSSEITQRTYDTVPQIAEMVPKTYKEQGSFAVSINPGVPPVKYVDTNGRITGFAPELLRAASQVMGIDANINKGTFDSMVPGLSSKQFDVIGSISDFEERRSKIDFIDYMYAGTAILASADFEKDNAQLQDLCGTRIGFILGTQQQGLLEAASKKCEDSGNEPIAGSSYQDTGAAVLAVKTGQDDGAWIDAPAALYNAGQDPETFKTVYLDKESMVYGIGVHKDNSELRDALQAAIQHLVTTGDYEELITHFGLEELSLPEIPLNQGGSVDG